MYESDALAVDGATRASAPAGEQRGSGANMSDTPELGPSQSGAVGREPPSTAADPLKDDPTKDLLISRPDKWRNFYVRTAWTVLMLAAFVTILYMGHGATALFVMLLQFQMFREVANISSLRARHKKIIGVRRFTGGVAQTAINYFFLISTIFQLYGRTFATQLLSLGPLANVIKYHTFYSFLLFMAGFVMFTLSLQRGKLKQQFSHFGMMLLSLFFVVVLSSAVVRNVFEGLFWFVFPTCLIIVNDITAYLFGFFFGRTPLIKLSPKKTWEGFIGATFSTIAFAWFVGPLFARIPHLICRQSELFPQSSGCDTVHPVFSSPDLAWHCLAFGVFAATIAPFGGFFASGFKRAFGLKDFGDAIPGHGGVTDRMDCQALMGVFVYVYFQNFIRHSVIRPEQIIARIASMTYDEQLLIHNALSDMLRTAASR